MKTARTPRLSGADFIVIGRPVLQASNPLQAVHLVVEDMAQAIL